MKVPADENLPGFLYCERLSFSEIRQIQEESGIISIFSIYIKPIDIIRIRWYSNQKMKKTFRKKHRDRFSKNRKGKQVWTIKKRKTNKI
ncbi:hypothetical protein HFM94_11625 [Faecalicatena fissicatena]|jgi:hypothetical protein|nr:hypothetical protein [Faecalicatena fissicatena]